MNAARRRTFALWTRIGRRNLASDSPNATGGARFRRLREWPLLDFSIPPKPRPAVPLKTIPQIEKDDQYYASLNDPDYFQVTNMVTVRELMDARVHLGHKMGTLNDTMKPFLFGERLGVCVFDLDQTIVHLRAALNFVAHTAYRRGVIVFFGGDSWNIHTIEKTAKEIGEFSHCRRFIPGTLVDSNKMFGNVIRYPDLGLFCTTMESVFEQHKAIAELNALCVPTVGVVDSNCDPSWVTYPIPGNDDSQTAVRLYLKLFKEAIRRGKEKAKADFPELTTAMARKEGLVEERRS